MLLDSEMRLGLALMQDEARQQHEQVESHLSEVIRYQGLAMIHPSNVANHQRLVTSIALTAANIWSEDMGILVDIQPATVIRMAKHHDDHEADPLVGDIPTSIKEEMTTDENAELKEKEYEAHKKLAQLYGLEIGSIEYQKFLQEKYDLDSLATLEAECTKTGDLLHATWEVMHECLSGNQQFLPLIDKYKERSEKLAQRSPLWRNLRYHKAIQLDDEHFPTSSTLENMPRITEVQLSAVNAIHPETWDQFVRIMNNPKFPVWYRTGFDITLSTFGIHNLGKVIFPKWKKSFYPPEPS